MKNLAYHSPFLPQKSGISVYSSDLLSYLSKYYKITIISDEEDIEENYPVIKYSEFYKIMDNSNLAFERNIYNMGNHAGFHSKIYDCALKYPGVVILHDFCLSGFAINYCIENNLNFANELIKNYGIRAYYEYYYNKYEDFSTRFMLNKNIIKSSRAIISHTQKSFDLAKEHYGNSEFLNLVALIKKSEKLEKEKYKKELDLEGSKIYGLFGFVQPSKQNLEIIKSWARAMKDKNALLLVVGEIHKDLSDYKNQMDKIINENNITNIKFIGWADSQFYKKYLQACDVCICLRKTHLGEASAALLDCLNYGNTTITNFNGFEDCSIYIPKVSNDGHELDRALLKAFECDGALAKKAKEKIAIEHDPDNCAKKIYSITEKAYGQIKQTTKFTRILVDLSSIVLEDPKAGISRVVWQELNELLKNTYINIIPIAFNGVSYVSAYKFMLNKLGLPCNIEDEKIIPQNGDIFYGLDFSVRYRCDPEISTEIAHQNGFFKELKNAGGKVFFRVYDLLPLSHPEFFPYHAGQLHLCWCELLKDIGALLIPISKRVAKDLKSYGFKDILPVLLAPHFKPKKIVLENLENSISENSKNSIPTFICVGTIEERKGIKAIALAFEKLALEGIDAKLIIVGRLGRVDDDFKVFLESGKQANIDFKGFVSDDELLELYASSHALIAASYDEGFGLPLIESGLPVIARDIEVFKEVLEDNALYFKDTFELIKVIKDFITGGTPPLPTSAKRSYKDVASEILKIFFE